MWLLCVTVLHIDECVVTTGAMIPCLMISETIKALLLASRSTERDQALAIDVIKKMPWTINIPVPERSAPRCEFTNG